MKNFNEEELYIIQDSLKEYSGNLAKIIATRNSWDWESFKNSAMCGFRNEEEFKNWINDMNEDTKEKIKQVEKIKKDLDYIIYGE